MIKECPVILNNEAVTVVKFGDTEVQFSSIMKDEKTVNVKYENGKYSIVDHVDKVESVITESDDVAQPIKAKTRKNKKTIKQKLDGEVEEKDCIEVIDKGSILQSV